MPKNGTFTIKGVVILKIERWAKVILDLDVWVFIASLLVHLCASFLNLKHPLSQEMLWADFYFCCAGIAWAVFGFLRNFIMSESKWGDRLLNSIFIAVVFPALLWVLDCVIICLYTRITPVELVWGICSTAKYTLRHIYIFLITYIVRIEMTNHIKTIKSIGLVNTIFGEED